ncbi:MAG: DNA translocase FtsK [Planctomycetes bacterium]|nr:DNA translocase FtsK [Planctomycetota bacterium]
MAGSKEKKAKRDRSRGPGLFERMGLSGDKDRGANETAQHLQEIKGLVLIGFALWLFVSLVSFDVPTDATEVGNWGGQAGAYVADWFLTALGWSSYSLALLALAWGAVLVAQKRITLPLVRVLGSACFLIASAFLFELAVGDAHRNDLPKGPGGYLALELVGPGVSGQHVPPILVQKLGYPGLWILLVLSTLISFMLATEMAFYPAATALRDWIAERQGTGGESAPIAILGWFRRLFVGLWSFLRGADLEVGTAGAVLVPAAPSTRKKSRTSAPESPPEPQALVAEEDDEDFDGGDVDWVDDDDDDAKKDDDDDDDDDEKEKDDDAEEAGEDYDGDLDDWSQGDLEESAEGYEVEVAPRAREPAKAPAARAPNPAADLEPIVPPLGDWKFPPLELLEPAGPSSPDDERAIEAQARRLENALKSFRVEAGVVAAKVGPAVTLYELEVAQGTRLNKVTQLSQEIAAALRAKSVRIIAPIPGKSTIGIEVPNEKRRVVRLSELVTQKAYDKKFLALPLFLGMDAEGNAIVEDLSRMPHLLIAGTTGSGKSVCINGILVSLLLTRSPHDVQLILVDPKMVELQMFAQVPHLMLPVVSDMRQATNVLLWAVDKMEGRYELFMRAGVRNIKGYNALGEEGLKQRLGDQFDAERTPRHVPYIVMVIDEMADLMMASKKEAELSITRLAQKSRAVGIHVIVATQRPSTDVITGVLKGNLPCRIAFQVASKVDSRVILDQMGAEKLLGQGDMLYTPPQSSQIKRVQGALVEDHEIQGVVDFITQHSVPTFSQELVQSATGQRSATDGDGSGEDDELFDEAVRIILKSKRGSASLLQRALAIGYTRATRLLELMEGAGIVGAFKGSKAREVLMSLEDWERMHADAPRTPRSTPPQEPVHD